MRHGLSTGRLGIDTAIGRGGVPRAALTEIYGGPASGKTSLALHLIAESQRQGGRVGYIDAEHALSTQHGRSLDVDFSSVVVARPSSGEEGLDIARRLVRSHGLSLLILDSAAALLPDSEANSPLGLGSPEALRDLLNRGIRQLEHAASCSDTAVVVLNQAFRSRLRRMPAQEQSVGGWALPLCSSLRIHLRLLGALTQGATRVGSRIRLQVVKNRQGPAGAAVDLELRCPGGFSEPADLLTLGLTLAVVQRHGTALEWQGKRLPSRLAFMQWLDQAPDQLTALRNELAGLLGWCYSPATTVTVIDEAKLGP